MLESLVKAGAMDSLAAGSPALSALPTAALRARLFAAVEGAPDHGNRTRRDRDQGQAQLFGGADAGNAVPPIEAELPEAPAWTDAQQLSGEKESLGLYWSGHPIERYSEELRKIGARPIAELLSENEGVEEEENGTAPEATPRSFEATVGGIIVAVRPLKTRKGARMAAFTLDDPQGSRESFGPLLQTGEELRPLADVIPIGPPVRVVLSVGDLFVYGAGIWLILAAMRGWTQEPLRNGYWGKHRPLRLLPEWARPLPVPPALRRVPAGETWGIGP